MLGVLRSLGIVKASLMERTPKKAADKRKEDTSDGKTISCSRRKVARFLAYGEASWSFGWVGG
jgi:hypothetical protein